jgi:hypothetical protein
MSSKRSSRIPIVRRSASAAPSRGAPGGLAARRREGGDRLEAVDDLLLELQRMCELDRFAQRRPRLVGTAELEQRVAEVHQPDGLR